MAMADNKGQVPAQMDAQTRWKMEIRDNVSRAVSSILTGDRAKDVGGRVMIAIEAARSTTPEIMECSHDSVKRAIALMILTDTRPGGAAPQLYLIPKRVKGKFQLHAWFSHRALITFANRAGYIVSTALVGVGDELTVIDGEVHHVAADPDNPPTKYQDLRGIVVYAWPKGDKASKVGRYVPKAQIEARRAVSDSAGSDYSPWTKWPIEMAEKTAIKYVVGRGLFPVDDAADYTGDVGEPQRGPFAHAAIENQPQQTVSQPSQSTGSGMDGLAAVVGASGENGDGEIVDGQLETQQ